MSIAIMSRLFKMHIGSCSRKLLAIRLADFADDEGRGIWPTVARLARETEMSERSIQRTLKEFVDEGLLVVVTSASGRPGQATRYDFDMDVLAQLEARKHDETATGDSVSPVMSGDSVSETGDTDSRDGCHSVTRTIIEPLDKPSLRESAREAGEEGNAADGSESREAIERAFMRFFPKWPTYVSDSQPAARKAWFALTASERLEAVERIGDYLAADKAGGRKYHCSAGAYLAERRWQNLPAPVRKQDLPKVAKPFGKAWSALRLSELLKPPAHLPPLTATLRMVINQGGEVAERMKLERRWRYGWPLVSRMHDLARDFTGVMVPPELVAAGQCFQQVRRGGVLEAAWKRLHERNGWPWLPEAGSFEWVYFPAIADGVDDYDAAVAAALMDFKARIEDHAHVAAE